MFHSDFVNSFEANRSMLSNATVIILPPLASRLPKRVAKSFSLALLKTKDNSVADGKS
jgi:hypothetical protein